MSWWKSCIKAYWAHRVWPVRSIYASRELPCMVRRISIDTCSSHVATRIWYRLVGLKILLNHACHHLYMITQISYFSRPGDISYFARILLWITFFRYRSLHFFNRFSINTYLDKKLSYIFFENILITLQVHMMTKFHSDQYKRSVAENIANLFFVLINFPLLSNFPMSSEMPRMQVFRDFCLS